MSKTYGGDTPGGVAKNEGRVHVVHEKPAPKSAEPIKFFLDGKEVEAEPGETIFRVARRHDIKLPHLCYSPKPGYRPDGNCRVCMVEVEGERVLAASCIRTPTPGMKVNTQTDRAKASRDMVLELLMADQPPRDEARDPDSDFWKTATRQKVSESRFPAREKSPAPDRSHPAMAVNLDA
jgi:formate dehydrogenase major subunit